MHETDLREPLRAGADDDELEEIDPRRGLAQGAQAPRLRAGLSPAAAHDEPDRRLGMTEPEQDRTLRTTTSSLGGSPPERDVRRSDERAPWLRCYRCWSQNLEAQVHYDAILGSTPSPASFSERARRGPGGGRPVPDCMHDQPHLTFTRRPRRAGRGPLGADGHRHAVGRLLHGHRRPGPGRDLLRARGRRLAHLRRVRRRRHARVLHARALPQARRRQDHVHLLVELYARSAEEATEVLEEAVARRSSTITSLAEESRPPAAESDEAHWPRAERRAERGCCSELVAS